MVVPYCPLLNLTKKAILRESLGNSKGTGFWMNDHYDGRLPTCHEIRFEINNIFPVETAGLSFGPGCEVGSSRLLGADTTCIKTRPRFSDSMLTRPPSRNAIPCICAIRERILGLSLWQLLSCQTVILLLSRLLSPVCGATVFPCHLLIGVMGMGKGWCWGLRAWSFPLYRLEDVRLRLWDSSGGKNQVLGQLGWIP